MKALGPYFPFYVDDFIGGTTHMSATEVGAYVRMLCYQWTHGSCPSNPVLQTRICGYRIDKIKSVLDKFRVCEDGLLRNDRMVAIREDRMAYVAEQSRKGKLSAASRGSTAVESRLQPDGQPDANPPSASPLPATKNKKSSSAKPQKVTWLTPYAKVWGSRCGGDMNMGVAAKYLKPLHDAHGDHAVSLAFDKYLAEVGKFASIPTFASKFGLYATKPPTKPIYDADENLRKALQ